MRRIESFRRHVPTRFLINQCQIIAFLILKSYIIQNSRIEFRGIVLPVKLHLLLFYSPAWYICDFIPFHIEIEGKCGWIIGGGGWAKGMLVCWPPSQIIGGLPPCPSPKLLGGLAPLPPTPSAYDLGPLDQQAST